MILDSLLRNFTAGGVGGVVGIAPKIIMLQKRTFCNTGSRFQPVRLQNN